MSTDYKVKDISQAEFGRKEITIAEHEMPGLMALRAEYKGKKPLKGAKIAGCLHMTIQTAVLIETLVDLGAEVRWSSCNIFSTQDHAAAAIAAAGIAVFAWKGMNAEEFDWCIEQTLKWPDGSQLNMILDDGGDLTNMVHDKYPAAHRGHPRPLRGNDDRRASPLRAGQEGHAQDAGDQRQRLVHQEQVRQSLRLPRIVHRRGQARDRRDDRGQGRRRRRLRRRGQGLRAGRARASARACVVTEIDPINALQAAMEGYQVVTMDDAARYGDIFVTTTGNVDVITRAHMDKMKTRPSSVTSATSIPRCRSARSTTTRRSRRSRSSRRSTSSPGRTARSSPCWPRAAW